MWTVYDLKKNNLELKKCEAILCQKEESDLLSRMFLGIEFQIFAPAYMKLFFILSMQESA